MKYTLVFLFLILVLGYELEGKAIKNIFIAAKYCNGEPLFFSYQNYYGDHVTSHEIDVISGWRVITTEYPTLLVFSGDWKLFPVYAQPGDTIHAVCNRSYGIEFFGNRGHAELNVLSVIEQKVGFLWPSLMGIRITKNLSFHYLSSTFDSLYIERKKLLESNNKEIPDELNTLFLKFFKYRTAGDYLIPYSSEDMDTNFNLSTDIPIAYLQKLKTIKLSINEDALQADRLYRTYLLDYNEYLAHDSIRNGRGRHEVLFNTAKYHFDGVSKDYLLFHFTKNNLIDEPVLVDDFRKNCKNILYVGYIDSLIEKRNNLNRDRQVLQGTLSKPNGISVSFEDFLKAYRGKPIYIDFWASWCGPCIMEISPLKEFERKFKAEIDFVSISIDEDKSKWLKAIRKYSLDNKNQWLIAKDSPLTKYIDIKGIPRFILFDRNGQAVSLDAARPSNANELTLLLEKVLKQ